MQVSHVVCMYAIDCNFLLLYAVDRNKCPKDIKRAYPERTWVQCTSLTKIQAQLLKSWHCRNCSITALLTFIAQFN